MGRRIARRFKLCSIPCMFNYTNEAPHERMFKFLKRATTGTSTLTCLLTPGTVLQRRFIRNLQCKQVKLLDANPTYAHVVLSDGRESIVSTSNLALLSLGCVV